MDETSTLVQAAPSPIFCGRSVWYGWFRSHDFLTLFRLAIEVHFVKNGTLAYKGGNTFISYFFFLFVHSSNNLCWLCWSAHWRASWFFHLQVSTLRHTHSPSSHPHSTALMKWLLVRCTLAFSMSLTASWIRTPLWWDFWFAIYSQTPPSMKQVQSQNIFNLGRIRLFYFVL